MKRRYLGIPAFLICIVFSLSGISVGLFSMIMSTVIEEYFQGPLPPSTESLLNVPVLFWIFGFFVLGVTAAFFFERAERVRGEVPARTAGLIAIVGLMMVLSLLVGFALPLMEQSGQVAHDPGNESQAAVAAQEDGPHIELATQ